MFIHVKKTFKALLCQMCGKRFKKRNENHKMQKAQAYMVLSQRYQDSRHLLTNPTVLNYVMGFSDLTQRFTPLKYLSLDRPLSKGQVIAL